MPLISLEVFNRRGVRKVKKPHALTDEICQYFFECQGKANVTLKLCVQCRDSEKNRKSNDCYFIDLAEVSQERSIFCKRCLSKLVNKHVIGSYEVILDELLALRKKQPNGVFVDPFALSCGY